MAGQAVKVLALPKVVKDEITTKLNRARQLLAEATDVPSAKQAVDIAYAAEVYARRANLGDEAIQYARTAGVDAKTLLGRFLKAAPKNPGVRMNGKSKGNIGGNKVEPPKIETLRDAGIPKKLSTEAQSLVKIADERPDLYEAARTGGKRVSAVLKQVKDAEAEAARIKAAEEAAKQTPDKDFNVKCDDFRNVGESLEDDSVDLIFTDPPYDRKTLPLYGDMAALAARALKPGGSLICYLGQYLIGDVCNLVTPHLRLWWTLACLHTGNSARMTEYGIVVKWKPMLWFVKGTRRDKKNLIDDLVVSTKEKDSHEWQQSVVEASYYIEKLTKVGENVFDPFCGSGTTAVAAKKLGRNWLTCDVDEAAVKIARKRLHDLARD